MRLAMILALATGAPVGGWPDAGAAAPSPASKAPAPSLLLITIDTWRWDYIGASGAGRVRTPALDRLAGEGVYEREAVAPCPLTTPAHASLFTGLDIHHHGVLDCTTSRLDQGPATLAEVLRSKGLKTAAFVAGETLKRRYGLDRGFDLYDDSGMGNRSRGDWMAAGRDGAAVTEAVLSYLKTRGASVPLFVWAHYYDLHLPYRARPALDPLYPRDSYAAQAAFVDGQVGRLRSALEADAGRSWRVVVIGDHGEGLGERNEDTHGMGLYRATLHVPLIVWPRPARPFLHPRPWGLVDVLPTLRAWFDLPRGRGEDGESLFGEGRRDRWLTSATAEPTLMFGVAPFKGIRQSRYFYLKDGSEELYDLASDPGERNDLGRESAHRKVLESLRGISDRTWPRNWPSTGPAPSLPLKNEELENLQSLGYISGRVPSGRSLQHASVGKVLLDRSLWDRAREEAFKTRKGDGLMSLLARLVADYPASAFLHGDYGVRLAQAGNLQEAIRQMEDAIRLDARDGAGLANLGGLYLQDGRDGPAEACLKKALALDPANPMAHKNLGILHAEYRRDPGRAARHYREYLRLDPDSPDAPAIKAYLADHQGADPAGPGKSPEPAKP
jgi:arylsulfatase A-like enzyme